MNAEPISLSLSTGATIALKPYMTKAKPAEGKKPARASHVAWGIIPKGQTTPSAPKVTAKVLGGSVPEYLTVLGVKVPVKSKPYTATPGKRSSTPEGTPTHTFSTVVPINGETKRVTLWVHDYGTHFKIGGGVISAKNTEVLDEI